MKREDIIIRDPFVLVDEGKYYLYGTRSETAWGEGKGFDVYVSDNLDEWTGPHEIFRRPEGFWADKEYWAPECVKIDGKYYLIATLGAKKSLKGIQILVSDSPTGPFTLLQNGPVTPKEWNCIDGTVFTDKVGKVWLIFSHGFPQEPEGAIMAAGLSGDLKKIETDIQTLFYATEAPWSIPIPFAEKEFGLDGDNYFSDGPYLFYNEKEELCMLWSSWSERGYAMGISISKTGNIEGPWDHSPEAAFYGGGHGMVFTSCEGKRYVTWHAPNESGMEHPQFVPFIEFVK